MSIFDFGTVTHAPAKDDKPFTLEAAEMAIAELEARTSIPREILGMRVVESSAIPEGYVVMQGHNSFAILTPDVPVRGHGHGNDEERRQADVQMQQDRLR